MSNNAKNKRFLRITGTAAVLILFIGVAGYKLGYRFQDNFTIRKIGTISLYIPVHKQIYS